jgi:undecaprenyl-diphosphatase
MFDVFSGVFEFVVWVDQQVVELVLALRHPVLTKVLTSVTGLGSAAAAAVFLGICYLADWDDELYTSAIALAVTGLVVGVLMLTIQRPFPPGPVCMTDGGGSVTSSFPSGHAAAVTIYALTAHRSTVLPSRVVGGLAGMIAISRVYLGTHYFSDTVAGVLIGIGAFYVAVRLRQRLSFDQFGY